MSKKSLSTFEREMQQPEFREQFETAYKEFLLSELILTLMENDNKSVRKLASEVGLSPSVIQKLRSGVQEDVKFRNFLNISYACGYRVVLEKGKERIYL